MRILKSSFALFFAAISSIAFAGPTTAPSTQSSSEVTTLDAVQVRYDLALKTVRSQYIHDLHELFHRAMKSENLDQANLINQRIHRAETESKPSNDSPAEPAPPTKAVQVQVHAADEWQSALPVHKGDYLWFSATGQWCMNNTDRANATCDADGLNADGNPTYIQHEGLLMGRIGKHMFFVGKENHFVATEDGPLEFRVNDWNLGDNDGSLSVTIRRRPQQPSDQ
jgi:hypothetical protein